MEELKTHQPSMTIDEQVENLKGKGLVISDEEYAKKVLSEISYFRLIKAYSLGLKEKNGYYHDDVSFEQLVELYYFNASFRQITFKEIEKIEVALRCRISNFIADTYGVLGYCDEKNFKDKEYHATFINDVKEEISRNSRAPFVKNFKENYEGGQLPIYALVEILSFGTLSKFYKNMKNADKKQIARSFGIGYTYFESWIESISYVRNICAHYGRIYNAKLSKTPMMYKQYSEAGIGNNRIFAVLLCIKSILISDESWNHFVDKLQSMIDKSNYVDISTMGFPDDWIDYLKV